MSGILSRTLPLNPQETPTSYCSRLAAWNWCDAREFSSDMGFTLSGLVDGDEKALVGLADVSGVDVEILRDRSFAKIGERLFRVCGQIVTAAASRRNHVRFCPECLSEDVAAWPDLNKAAPFQRVHWQLSWFRSCPVHGCGLISCGKPGKSAVIADFTSAIAPYVEQTRGNPGQGAARQPTSLERYLFSRLYGLENSSKPWLLDGVPMYLAVRLCEVVGAVSIYGAKASVRELDEEAAAQAAGVGCDILIKGEEAFRDFVRVTMSAFWNSSGDPGGSSLFGVLYDWLLEAIEEKGLDPVRDVIREEMLATLPLAPSDTIFGVSVGQRRIWSIAAAARHIGVTALRMRNYLEMRGLVNDANKALQNERIVFPVEHVDPLLEPLRSLVIPKDAAKRLRITRQRLQDLMDDEVLVPFFKGGEGKSFRTAFTEADLNGFIEKVDRQVTMEAALPGMTPPSIASKLCRSAYARVVRLVVEGRLARVAKSEVHHGDLPVVVDPAEVRRMLVEVEAENEPWPYLTIDEVRERMAWGAGTTRSLVFRGLLAHRVMPNPVTKRRCIFIHRDDLECFDREYVTLGGAAKEVGYEYIRENYLRQGVKPVIQSDNGSQPFYSRMELQMI